ncbi:MAG: carbohydrate ABC transporter substrate-binding protein [Oscillospiraceae bacterium]|nr:carbohydrate ABC transporter substrate-binding protein [Oscillospiraceae bacterium]
MRKPLWGFLLSAALLCGVLSGCTGEQKPDVTLVIKAPVFQLEMVADSESADVYTFLKKAANAFAEQYTEANVTIDLSQFELARRQTEVEERFDTDEAVDVLWGDVNWYTYTGRKVPLDDLITDELRADIAPQYWDSCSVDGKTYTMPFLSSQTVLCYNKDLFRQAGLDQYITDEDVIQSWTLEEWEYILSTLRANLPSTVFPLMMFAGNTNAESHTMTYLRSHGGSFFGADGRVDLDTPEMLAAMQWIRDSNEKGYFPPHPERLVMLDNYSLFMNNQLAIYCVNVSLQTFYDSAGLDCGFVNFPSQDGAGFNVTSLYGFGVFDNGDETRLQAAKDFVSFVYSTDWLDYSAGSIPASSRVMKKYAEQLAPVQKYIANMPNNNDYTQGKPNWDSVREAYRLRLQELFYQGKSVEQVALEMERACNEAIDAGYQSASLHE